MEQVTNEMKQDIEELQKLLSITIRPTIRKLVAAEILNIESKLLHANPQLVDKSKDADSTEEKQPKLLKTHSPTYSTNITKYAFDESLTAAKVYATLSGVETLSKDQFSCDFTESSFKFTAHNLKCKNHVLQINALAYNIKPNESTYKIKSGEFVIILKKAQAGENWSVLTKAERKAKEIKDEKLKNKPTDNEDPMGGIMGLMKNMYEEGDDDMKRMIKKTWYESQQKQGNGSMPAMPNF